MIFSLPSHLSIPISLLHAVLCPPALVVVVPATAGDSEPSGSGTPSSCLGGCGYSAPVAYLDVSHSIWNGFV